MRKIKDGAVHFGERLKKGYGKIKEVYHKAKAFGQTMYKNPFVKGVVDSGVEYAKKNHPQLAAAAKNVHDTVSGKKGIVDAFRDGKSMVDSKEKRKALVASGRDVLGNAKKNARIQGENLFNERSKKVLGGSGRGGGAQNGGIV